MARKSRYREVLEQFEKEGRSQDELVRYLEQHRLDDPTITLGYYLLRAEEDQNLNNADIAERAEVSRGFISALLSGKTSSSPFTYKRLSDVLGISPVEFHIAEGWLEPADVAAYQLPGVSDLVPIAEKLVNLPVEDRRRYVALMLSILETVMAEARREGRLGG